MTAKPDIKIAVIGDVHDLWEPEDEVALKALSIDLVLFVGDFGNESVEIVRLIAGVDLSKAAIAGNHDSWFSATDWGISRCPYDRTQEDWVQQQLDLLGAAHVGFGKLDFPELGLSVVGSRPFSWGGSVWKNEKFYRERFGINSFEESVNKIVNAAEDTASDTVILIGHNGPTGMGDQPEDPCGKDWQPIGGDHGDPDFETAISKTRQLGKTIPLVTFGHMHHSLRHTKQRLRRAIHVDQETVYLNAARVPRIVETAAGKLRNFSIATLRDSSVRDIALVWVNSALEIASQEVLYQAPSVTMT